MGSKTWMTAAVGLLAVLALSAFAVHYARGQIAQQTAQMRAQVHNLATQVHIAWDGGKTWAEIRNTPGVYHYQ